MQRIRVEAGFADIVGHGILWLVLIVITLGLAGLVWPYYAFRFVLNRTVVETSEGDMRFVVEGSFPEHLGHAILWASVPGHPGPGRTPVECPGRN